MNGMHLPEQNCSPDCGGHLRQFGEDVSVQREFRPCVWKPLGDKVIFIPYGMLRNRFFPPTSPSRVSTLFERTLSSTVRSSICRSIVRVTRPDPRLVSASKARHSRV